MSVTGTALLEGALEIDDGEFAFGFDLHHRILACYERLGTFDEIPPGVVASYTANGVDVWLDE